MDAIKVLLDRYSLADPAQAQPGVFSDTDLQALYDQLHASGIQSLGNAIKAGGAVEEVDILDLQARSELTDQADILQVYGNLERGSENHLPRLCPHPGTPDRRDLPAAVPEPRSVPGHPGWRFPRRWPEVPQQPALIQSKLMGVTQFKSTRGCFGGLRPPKHPTLPPTA